MEKLERLLTALTNFGVSFGVRNKTVASATHYSEGSIKRLLSGNTPLTDRFIKEVCAKFQIREEWVIKGEEPQLIRELPIFRLRLALQEIGVTDEDVIAELHPEWHGYSWSDMPDLLSGRKEINRELAKEISIVFGINESWVFNGQHPMFDDGCKVQYRSKQINNSGQSIVTSLNEIFTPPASEKQLKADISRHFEYCSEECTDDLNLGEIMSDILFHLPHLPRHEVLELLHQVWKLRYNRSDSLAVQVADEDFERYDIKPKTRIKLERIPVEGAEGEEGK